MSGGEFSGNPPPHDPDEPRHPDDLELGDDFLSDLDQEIEEIAVPPTEEYEIPETADKGPSQEDPSPGTPGREAEDVPVDEVEEMPVDEEIPEEEEIEEEEEELEDDEPLGAVKEEADEREDADQDDLEQPTEEAERPTAVAATRAKQPTIRVAKPQAGFGRPRLRFPLWARFILASFLIISTVAAATASSLILWFSDIAGALGDDIELQGVENQLEQVDGGAPQTILIIGSDKRRGDGQGFGLSDTSILLRLDPDRNAIALFSIPRDLQVNIPGRGPAKFNEAFALGGPKLTLETVKELVGIDVHHLVQVNFVGFAKAVNAIGCVYVDVDRRYYHSNEGLPAAAQYAEIDVRPGYQRLCGYKALEYVRYRHTDNDVVRAARQQDFLREARHRVPAEKLLNDRTELIRIFTDYTISDIRDAPNMIQVMKLFIEARDQPVREVHFPGTVGETVTVTPGQIEQAVSEFLGIEGTGGPRGQSAAAEDPVIPEEPKAAPKGAEGTPAGGPAKKGKKGKKKDKIGDTAEGLEGGNFGKRLAYRIRRRNPSFPIYYPTTVVAGSQYDQQPRAYRLQDHSLKQDQRFSYKFTLETPSGDYYGLQGTDWEDAPILDAPHEEREIGDRNYKLYFDNDRLRMVAWEEDGRAYWISNSLLQTLSADQMIAIARGAKLLAPPKGA